MTPLIHMSTLDKVLYRLIAKVAHLIYKLKVKPLTESEIKEGLDFLLSGRDIDELPINYHNKEFYAKCTYNGIIVYPYMYYEKFVHLDYAMALHIELVDRRSAKALLQYELWLSKREIEKLETTLKFIRG